MIGTKLGERYELTSELGRGGMGVVYRARDPLLGRDVAVKMIPPARLSENAEERFQREARVVAQMDHPALVPIHDFGRHEDALFFVMPLIEGVPLRDLIGGNGLDLGETLSVGIQVAEALDYSHSHGVVHRDIKPGNIMVSREEGVLRVRIMDFGLAHTVEGARTSDTAPVGTLICASPEQISGTAVDGRSDIYSLGSVLYECLAGVPPFSGNAHSMVYRILHEPAPPLRSRGVDVEIELERLVLGCLAKDPARRPQRGRDVAASLAAYRDQLLADAAARFQLDQPPPVVQSPAGEPLPSRLVGRREEMGELRRRLELALEGECQLVLVGGETGAGKTRLLRELENLARAREIRVLHGRFAEQNSGIPHQGLCELIYDFFRSRGRDGTKSWHSSDSAASVSSSASVGKENEAATGSAAADPTAGTVDLSDLAAELVALFPTLSEIREIRHAARRNAGTAPGDGARDAESEATYVFELLARTLARLADGAPLVLMVENLHDGGASIDALQYIVRRLGPTPTLTIASYRPGEVDRDHPLARLLKGAADDPRCGVLHLGPLKGEDFYQLVEMTLGGRDFDDDLVSRLEEATEGNPYFLQELVRSLVESGSLVRDGEGVWALKEADFATNALPETVQQAVEQRLERLSPELHRILRAASVLGKRFAFRDLEELLAATRDGADEDLDESVDALLELGVLEEDRKSRGDYLTFASSVVREVFYRELPRRRRRMLHRAFARQLEARNAKRLERVYPQLVHHYAAASVASKTLYYGRELARRSLLASSPYDALRAARTALEFADDEDLGDELDLSSGVVGELYALLARAYRAVGQNRRALSEAERAVAVFSQLDLPAPAAKSAVLAAETAWQGRRVDSARWWIERGLELARGSGETKATLKLLSLGATVAHLRGEQQAAQRYIEELEALGKENRSAASESESLPRGGKLSAALPCPVTSFDPAECEMDEENEVVANVFETLLTADANGNPTPLLAQRWESHDNGRSFTLVLRREARFSDGRPIGARDVKASFERAARRSRRPVSAFLALVGAEELLRGEAEGIRGIVSPPLTLADRDDPERVIFYLREPLPIFPTLLADSRTAIVREVRQGPTGTELLGTGAFCTVNCEPQHIVLERNSRYWRREPAYLETLEFVTIPDAAAIAHRLRSGEIDLARDLPPRDLEDLLRDRRWHAGLREATKRNTYFVLANRRGPLTRRSEVRWLLLSVIRVRDLVWRHLGRFAQPAVGLLPPGVLGHDPGRRQAILSPEAARDVVAQIFKKDEPRKLRIAVQPTMRDRFGSLTRALFEGWEELGFQNEVVTTSMEEYVEQSITSAGIDLLIGRWTADYADPDSCTYLPFHSEHGLTRGYVSSPELDKVLEQARRESDADRRRALYRQFERELAEESLLLPLFHDVDYRIAAPRVRGLRLGNTVPYVDYARLAKTAQAPELTPHHLGRSGEVHVPIPSAIASLDPVGFNLADQMEVISPIFETLTRLAEGTRIVPWLAEHVETLEEGRAYRLKLRPGVRFHDDRPLGARDVRYTFERALRRRDPGLHFPLLPIRGARALRDGTAPELRGLHILANDEIALELEEPLAFYPALLAYPSTGIVPEGSDRFAGAWDEGCVGTGPFRVLRWVEGERLDLGKNPHYWRGSRPLCERLTFHFSMSPERTLRELREGLLSLASHLRPDDIEALRRDPRFVGGYRAAPRLATFFLALNARQGPLSDPDLRLALAASLDTVGPVRESLGRVVSRAHGLIPPGLLGYRAGRRSLREARPAGSARLAGLKLRLGVLPAYKEQYSRCWNRLRGELESLGLILEEVTNDPVEILRMSREGTLDVSAFLWIANYPDADAFTTSLLHSSEGVLAGLWGSSAFDRLCERGRWQGDPAERHELYREIESRLVDEAFLIPLFHEQSHSFGHPNLRGLRPGLGIPEIRYEELYLEP